MDHISRAWEVLSRDILQWIALFVVAILATVLTCGLGGILVGPNLVLATKNAIVRGVAPQIGDLFQTDLFVEYIVYWIIMFVLSVVGGWIPLIGTVLVSVLTFWTLPLIVDRRFGAVEAFQASFHHAKVDFFPLLIFTIVLYLLAMAGTLACCVGLLITLPLSMVATWLYYEAEKEKIMIAAIAAGLKPIA